MTNLDGNVLSLITPKANLVYLTDDMTIRQALEKMRVHRFTAIPIINSVDGTYVGSVSEGDMLYNLVKEESVSIKELENKKITKIIRPQFMPAKKVDMTMEELVNAITIQNYVPVVDDRGILMGIVTRRNVMKYLVEKINSITK